ncbi:MAG TPA: hypothetical protein VIO16_03955, partial [Dehalococcoidia bacterium]
MTADRPPLRLITTKDPQHASPLDSSLEAALRLIGCDRGAIVLRKDSDAQVTLTSFNLSPEEKAACRSL